MRHVANGRPASRSMQVDVLYRSDAGRRARRRNKCLDHSACFIFEGYIMKFRSALCVATFAFAASAGIAVAQSSAQAPAPAPDASAPVAANPGSGLKTPKPSASRENATVGGDLEPDHPVAPQLNIPLGKPVPSPLGTRIRNARKPPAATGGGIDDTVARCQSEADEAARAACRSRSGH